MAEIKIRKKKAMLWPWILAILLILAIVVWFIATKRVSVTQNYQPENVLGIEQSLARKQKSITQVPGIVSLKLETYIT